jgi:hypothetical protein
MLAADETLIAPRLICAGDLVIAYMTHDSMKAVRVSDKGAFNCSMGTFKLADWIGKPFGSKVYSRQGAWLYLLRPSPELWTQVLMHRTQIIYVADIAQICSGLELSSGSVVCPSSLLGQGRLGAWCSGVECNTSPRSVALQGLCAAHSLHGACTVRRTMTVQNINSLSRFTVGRRTTTS